jgi:hypothetical protein
MCYKFISNSSINRESRLVPGNGHCGTEVIISSLSSVPGIKKAFPTTGKVGCWEGPLFLLRVLTGSRMWTESVFHIFTDGTAEK